MWENSRISKINLVISRFWKKKKIRHDKSWKLKICQNSRFGRKILKLKDLEKFKIRGGKSWISEFGKISDSAEQIWKIQDLAKFNIRWKNLKNSRFSKIEDSAGQILKFQDWQMKFMIRQHKSWKFRIKENSRCSKPNLEDSAEKYENSKVGAKKLGNSGFG